MERKQVTLEQFQYLIMEQQRMEIQNLKKS